MTTTIFQQSQRNKKGFYPITNLLGEQVLLPSVTTVLGQVIAKPALIYWAVNQQKELFQESLLETLTSNHTLTPELVWTEIERVCNIKQHERKMKQASNIGTATHAMIEQHIRRMLGQKVGPELENIPGEAYLAYESWKEWAEQTHFEPIMAEQTVYSLTHGYAGTLDVVCLINGKKCIADWKTGKAIYPESFLQNIAYREAWREMTGETLDEGWVIRLPKDIGQPLDVEAMCVPNSLVTIDDFLAVMAVWKWQQRMKGG